VVNLQGLVIGMVVGGSGQILPAEAIDGAIRTYLEFGRIMRPHIGLQYLMVSSNTAKARGLDAAGAQVVAVEAGSPAAGAGLVVNDVIIQVNGQAVEDSSLEQLLVPQGTNTMRLLVARGTQQTELTLTPVMR
jgi:S1-C subfamily serine protease